MLFLYIYCPVPLRPNSTRASLLPHIFQLVRKLCEKTIYPLALPLQFAKTFTSSRPAMEALSSSSAISSASLFSPKRKELNAPPRLVRIYVSSKKDKKDSDLQPSSHDSGIVPLFNNPALSKDAAMGLVLSAASVRGWTTGSGMEGPSVTAVSEDGFNTEKVSTLPWSLFTKSPRRRMRVAFTCNVCGQRTTRAINPHAYTDGTVFVQCCGCNVFHKLVDNLNLFHEMKCYVNPSFNYRDAKWDGGFKLFDVDDDRDDGGSDVFLN